MRGYFEGWYFKQQTERGTVALIPAMHMEAPGKRSASIQIVTEDAAYSVPVPFHDFRADRKALRIAAGSSTFSRDGIHLDIRSEGVMAQGRLTFGALSPIRYDIMGPFRVVPFMECRHSIFSMAHNVNGSLTVNGKEYVFDNAMGYIEGDRGASFPTRYMWTQAVWRQEELCSMMLSVADIPMMGMHFCGAIGVVLLNGQEYRLATYLGAHVTHVGNEEITIRQGRYALTVRRTDNGHLMLRAPVSGGMFRMIREAPSCRVHCRFSHHGTALLDRTLDNAGFEWELDT